MANHLYIGICSQFMEADLDWLCISANQCARKDAIAHFFYARMTMTTMPTLHMGAILSSSSGQSMSGM
jgi:hypothetical protein